MGLFEAIHDAEIDLFRAMNVAGTNASIDFIMVAFTILGSSYVIVFICVPLWLRGKRDSAFDIVVLIVLATLLAEALKILVARSRPDIELEDVKTIVSASGYSFPSGHATRAFAVAVSVLFVEQRRYGVLALAVGCLISVSRVYLGVHWPTDILAGAILGSMVAMAFMVWAKRSLSYRTLRERIVKALSRSES